MEFKLLILVFCIACTSVVVNGQDPPPQPAPEPTTEPDPSTLKFHPKEVNVPDVSYVTDSVEALKEAYLLSDLIAERAGYFVQVFSQKHKEKWGCVAGYEAFNATVKYFINIEVSDKRKWKLFNIA